MSTKGFWKSHNTCNCSKITIVFLIRFAKEKDLTRKIPSKRQVFDSPFNFTLESHSMRIKHIWFLSRHYQFLTYFWLSDVSIFMKSFWCARNHKFVIICFFFFLFRTSQIWVIYLFCLFLFWFVFFSNTTLLFYTLYNMDILQILEWRIPNMTLYPVSFSHFYNIYELVWSHGKRIWWDY